MKKIIIALSFTFAITFSACAGTNKERKIYTPEQLVNYAIQSQLTVPSQLTEEAGLYTAEVHFHITAQGDIIINEIISDSEPLKRSLALQTRNIKVNTAGLDTDSSYKMNVGFNIVAKD